MHHPFSLSTFSGFDFVKVFITTNVLGKKFWKRLDREIEKFHRKRIAGSKHICLFMLKIHAMYLHMPYMHTVVHFRLRLPPTAIIFKYKCNPCKKIILESKAIYFPIKYIN